MDTYIDDASFLSEYYTRKQYIDPTLERRGWLSKGSSALIGVYSRTGPIDLKELWG
jgi:type I site-specific restriction endonuclease